MCNWFILDTLQLCFTHWQLMYKIGYTHTHISWVWFLIYLLNMCHLLKYSLTVWEVPIWINLCGASSYKYLKKASIHTHLTKKFKRKHLFEDKLSIKCWAMYGTMQPINQSVVYLTKKSKGFKQQWVDGWVDGLMDGLMDGWMGQMRWMVLDEWVEFTVIFKQNFHILVYVRVQPWLLGFCCIFLIYNFLMLFRISLDSSIFHWNIDWKSAIYYRNILLLH